LSSAAAVLPISKMAASADASNTVTIDAALLADLLRLVIHLAAPLQFDESKRRGTSAGDQLASVRRCVRY
jgi:hypothetical protein